MMGLVPVHGSGFLLLLGSVFTSCPPAQLFCVPFFRFSFQWSNFSFQPSTEGLLLSKQIKSEYKKFHWWFLKDDRKFSVFVTSCCQLLMSSRPSNKIKCSPSTSHKTSDLMKMLAVVFFSFSTQPFTLMTSSPRVLVFTKKQFFFGYSTCTE